MQTTCCSFILDEAEEFTIRPPRSLRKWTVDWIEIHDGYFFLYGGPGRNKQGVCRRIKYAYCTVEEAKGMPAYIAGEVRRALIALEGATVKS